MWGRLQGGPKHLLISAIEGTSSQGGETMKHFDLESMSADELWSLYDDVGKLLAKKTEEELQTIAIRLRRVRPRKPYSEADAEVL
jgi:hypothetical protein